MDAIQQIDKTEPVNETHEQAAPTCIVGTEYIKLNTKHWVARKKKLFPTLLSTAYLVTGSPTYFLFGLSEVGQRRARLVP